MFAKSILVAFAVPALISGAALPQTIPDWDENSSDIVGGVAAAQGDLPFIVSVQLSGSHFCGGSLVNANTVVSAAHCYEGRTGSSWSIRAGSLVSDHLIIESYTLHDSYCSL
jgi:trypsin